jgi:hypothetical protein
VARRQGNGSFCHGSEGISFIGLTHSSLCPLLCFVSVPVPVAASARQVLDVDFAAGRATIKLVPRLDLAAMAKDHRSGEAPCTAALFTQ